MAEQPMENVKVRFAIDPSDLKIILIENTELEFTPSNWDTNQFITVHSVGTDFNLVDANADPVAITESTNRLFVADGTENKIFSYNFTGKNFSSETFDLDAANANVKGICRTNNRLLVLDEDKVFFYSHDGTRQAAQDFNLDSTNTDPVAIAFTYNRYLVVDRTARNIFLYDQSGTRMENENILLDARNVNASGIMTTEGAIHVLDSVARKTFAYTYTGKRGGGDLTFDYRNTDPRDIASTVDLTFVLDNDFKKIFTYPHEDISGDTKIQISSLNSGFVPATEVFVSVVKYNTLVIREAHRGGDIYLTYPHSNLMLTDDEISTEIHVRLSNKPAGNVLIETEVLEQDRFTIEPEAILFTQSSWNSDQALTVKWKSGVDGYSDIMLNPTGVGFTESERVTIRVLPDTVPPTVPTNFQIGAQGFADLVLSWTASTRIPDHYEIAYRTHLSNSWSVIDAPNTTHIVTGLRDQTLYYFSVRAVDADGNTSDWTNILTETMNFPTTMGGTLVQGFGELTVNWTNPYVPVSPNFTGTIKHTVEYKLQGESGWTVVSDISGIGIYYRRFNGQGSIRYQSEELY